MRCSSCGFDNPQGMQFCGHCGTPLGRRCSRCRFENPADFAFCGQCGTSLTGQTSDPGSPPPPVLENQALEAGSRPTTGNTPYTPRGWARRRALTTRQRRRASTQQETPEAERRQLTVLFCDLVDSTALSARLDPEELRELVRAYQTTCAEVIQRFDGYIAQYLGDGLLVYFGYPRAHEDDAQRAVRTGLAIVDALSQTNARRLPGKGVRLAVRLGIHTGLVVVGKMGGGTKQEQLALGETPNLAARLQGLASPDTVVTSAATYHLIQGLFECQDLGLHTLKGLSTPLQVYRVLRGSEAQSRMEVAVSAGLTPLVGRETEAVSHLTSGLEVLDTLPDTAQRAQQELVLQTTLGPALMAVKGYAAPEVERAYARARELCAQIGETPRLLRVLLGLGTFYFIRAQLQTARELGEQCLALAQPAHDPARLQQALLALGSTLFHLGELSAAHAHLEEGIVLHDPHRHHPTGLPAVADPRVACRAYDTWTLWHLGYPDQALQRSREALSLAQELSHAHSLAFALHFATGIHQYRGEAHVVQELAASAITLAAKQEFSYWVATATIWHGWALTAQGQHAAGIAQIRQGLDAYRDTGAALGWPLFLALLAEAYRQDGQMAAGLSVLTEALETAHDTGECWYEAELHRLQGELLWQQGGGAAAEASFQHALDVARQQQARAWELRAAVSLARLWRQDGRGDAARRQLAESYGWFTEGFDTADVQEAKWLLDALS